MNDETPLPKVGWPAHSATGDVLGPPPAALADGFDWRSENGSAPPKRLLLADDSTRADVAYRLACEGAALLWQGDFQNARQLLLAMGRRMDQRNAPRRGKATPPPSSPAAAFHAHRQAQAQRARTLGMLLIPVSAEHHIGLRRAPDVSAACSEAYGTALAPYLVSLRELLGLVGAHEWRKKGVPIPSLGGRIHPHYGVFSPLRGEYLDLINVAPLASMELAFDIGTGTGVIAALLARRGIRQIVATEINPRALECARDNLDRLGLRSQVQIVAADLFPEGHAPLIVCNPPWVPARPSSAIEHAVYDPDSTMLRGFLRGLAGHLSPGGEGWLILSDLAEHLGLRTRAELLGWISDSGLIVRDRHDIRPRHPKAGDENDPLYAARAAELTSLWRLAASS